MAIKIVYQSLHNQYLFPKPQNPKTPKPQNIEIVKYS
jgi:hypothetical protein